MIKKNIFLASAFFLGFRSDAQHILKPDYAELNFQPGYVIKNYATFPEVKSPAFGGGIRIGNKLKGTKSWHRYYHYPDVGFNFIFSSLGNKNVLGNIAALLPEISFRQRHGKKFSVSETAGLGISYFNKPYQQVRNPENIIIGSHITFCASVAVSFEYSLSNNLSLAVRPVIYHSSDSHTALPNVGMNLPLIGLGIKYFPHNEPHSIKIDSAVTYNKKIHFNFRLGLGVNEQGGAIGPSNGPKYPIYIASLFLSKSVSPVNKVIAGIEGWYNTGVYDYITSEDFFDDNQKKKSAVVALLFGHEFLMGHFSIVTQAGIYLHNPFYKEKLKLEKNVSFKARLKTIIPTRLGYQYYLFDVTEKQRHNLYFGIYIKANLSQADFLDTGIGYTF